MPIFIPIVEKLGFDLIWFGIVVIMVTEISLITPPVGMNVFVLKSMLPDVSLWTIFRGIGPFFAADLVRQGLVVFLLKLLFYCSLLCCASDDIARFSTASIQLNNRRLFISPKYYFRY